METKTRRKNTKPKKLTDPEKKVIKALKELDAYSEDLAVRPHQIKAKAFPDISARGNKIVNSPLYKLKLKKMVDQITGEEGRKPRWYLLPVSNTELSTKVPEGYLPKATVSLNIEYQTQLSGNNQ